MFENERNFRKAVGRLEIDTQPDPAHKERLRRQMLATFEQAGRSARAGARPAPPKTIRLVRAPALRLAAAAAILIVGAVGMWAWLGPKGPATFDQVRVATQKMPWLHAVATEQRGGQVQTDQYWYDFAGEKAFLLKDDGVVVAWDYGAGRQQFTYSPRVKALAITELSRPGLYGAESAYNLVDAFATFAAQNEVRRWDDEREGESVRSYEIEQAEPGISIDGRSVARLRMKIMADPQTGRIVAADIEHRSGTGLALAREAWVVNYPPSGPQSVYDLGVPRSVRVVDRRSGYISTPGDAPVAIPTPGASGRSRLVPLEIELPRPLFIGTPQDNRVPRLAKPRPGPRPPFLAPPGTTNVARGKPVTSSDPNPVVGSLDMITDGDKEAADGSFVELGPFSQHVAIDLQERCEIFAIVVWHYHQQPRVYFDVVVQVSNDPRFRRGVGTVFNNDIDNSAGLGQGRDLHYTETNEGKLIDTKGMQGRYVRLHSRGNTSDEQNHYIEVEVYGRPLR